MQIIHLFIYQIKLNNLVNQKKKKKKKKKKKRDTRGCSD